MEQLSSKCECYLNSLQAFGVCTPHPAILIILEFRALKNMVINIWMP